MIVTIQFHGPFRVATGTPRPGLNNVVDHDVPLPASSLKGVMRQSARILGVPVTLADAVFGTARIPSPWAWSNAVVEEVEHTVRARVAIDPETGAARTDFLAFGEEAWAPAATFEITRTGYLDPDTVENHLAVLACAAAGAHALGADRRRGLGWVSMTTAEPAVGHVLDRFERLLEGTST